jgi:hypothetical protein
MGICFKFLKHDKSFLSAAFGIGEIPKLEFLQPFIFRILIFCAGTNVEFPERNE